MAAVQIIATQFLVDSFLLYSWTLSAFKQGDTQPPPVRRCHSVLLLLLLLLRPTTAAAAAAAADRITKPDQGPMFSSLSKSTLSRQARSWRVIHHD